VPIIPGIKILATRKQLTSIPRVFHVDIPVELSAEVEAVAPERAVDVGVEWALQQSRELLDRGVPSIHFYVMQSSRAIGRLLDQLTID